MDISDGLLLDAQRLCKASRVGLVLDLDCVPLAEPSDDLAIVIRLGGDRIPEEEKDSDGIGRGRQTGIQIYQEISRCIKRY